MTRDPFKAPHLTDRRSILIVNGPNLNMLGQREPAIYGRDTLADIEAACRAKASELGLDIDFRQSNREGELVEWTQAAGQSHAGIIVNAGGYTHTSVALLDALTVSGLPVIEVHLSNIFRREEFRHHSYVSRAASGVICGFGLKGYLLALDAMAQLIRPD
jgi:3-dehydroquinate dehydratase-2